MAPAEKEAVLKNRKSTFEDKRLTLRNSECYDRKGAVRFENP